MNKSSSQCGQSERNCSSFFNESCDSVVRCCDFKQKYEDCYRDMSQTRIQCRNLRQENTVLRSTLRGTEEESTVLKNILAGKKQIIAKMNREAAASHQEIGRLQDQLHLIKEQHQEIISQKEQAEEERKRVAEDNKEMASNIRQLSQENKRLKEQLQKAEHERQRERNEHRQQVQRIMQEREQTMTQTNQLLFRKLQELSTAFNSPTKSSTKAYPVTNKQNALPAVTLNDLDSTLASVKRRQQQHQGKYQLLLQAKDTEIEQLKVKISSLQIEMAESMELFQQQIAQTQQLKQTLTQQQQQAEANEATRSKHSQREQILLSTAKRVANMLKDTLIENGDLIDRLLAALPQAKRFEIEVLMKEIEGACEQNCRNTLRKAISSKQWEQTNRTLEEVKQDYELLQLKHSTLQREYNQIIDDNQRLIKYNQLSRYRMIRNTPLESTPSGKGRSKEDSSNKENVGSTFNR